MDVVLKWNKMEGHLQLGKEGDLSECQHPCWTSTSATSKRQKVIGTIV